jgi:hypothetical protein
MAKSLRGKDPKHATPSKPKMLIFGKPGVGKTWGSLEFPSVYYIDTEGGADLDHYTDKLKASGGAYLGPRDGSNDFATVIEEVITLATTKHDYRTLVIDSFSKLFNTAVQLEHDRMSADPKRDMTSTFGAEKKPAIARTRQLVTWFEKLDMNVLLICHEKDVWKDQKVTGTTFDAWDKLEYELHLCLNIFKQGKSHKAKVGKCRLAQFKEAEVFDWSYAEFAARFGREVMEADAVTVSPASADQVKAVKGLVEAVRLDEETKIKWFEKAGVTSFEQMDADTIQKCIDFLKAKIPANGAA